MTLQFRYKTLQSKPSFFGDYLSTIFLTNTKSEVNIVIPGCSWLLYLTHIPMGFTSFEFSFKANILPHCHCHS